jgi:hypothetical protein
LIDSRNHPKRPVMISFVATFWTKYFWASSSTVAILVVLGSSIADRRRQRRARIDDVGFMPWTGITVLATLAAVATAALAIKS